MVNLVFSGVMEKSTIWSKKLEDYNTKNSAD
jgi:hypothetical protein